MNCKCCGRPLKDKIKCKYCGLTDVVPLDESGSESVNTMINNHRQNLVSEIKNIKIKAKSYTISAENKTTTVMDLDYSDKFDATECYKKMHIIDTKYFIPDPENAKDGTIEFVCEVYGKNKKFNIKNIDFPKDKKIVNVAFLVNEHLNFEIYLGNDDDFVKVKEIDIF